VPKSGKDYRQTAPHSLISAWAHQVSTAPLTRVVLPGQCRPGTPVEGTNNNWHLQSQCPALEEAIALAQDFAQIVRNRQPEQFDSLEGATQSHLPAFVRRQGLYED